MGPMRGRRRILQRLGVAAAVLLVGCGRSPQLTLRPNKVRRVGLLAAGSPEAFAHLGSEFQRALHDLGHVEGENVSFEYRHGRGIVERLPDLAAELVALPVDVIVAPITPTVRAAMQATSTIPIVTVVAGDPVREGLITSLAQPGGNVTGLTLLSTQLSAKRLEILRETVPAVSRVAALWSPAEAGNALALEQLQDAASLLGMQLISLGIRSPDEFESAFAVARQQTDAFVTNPGVVFFNNRALLAAIAARHRLPGTYDAPDFVRDGGLMSYGPSLPALYRRAAVYVDKILRGARPADLPVEQPTTFDLVINLKTAHALGLTIPRSVLQQATETIE